MTDLVVRRLLIDLEPPIARHWYGGDAFRTALFNALSMSLPVGEQFIIDSVRNGYKALPADKQARFKDEVQGFIGQEATHRHIHALFNQHPERQGLVSEWGQRAKLLADSDPRHALAATAANEHFTASPRKTTAKNVPASSAKTPPPQVKDFAATTMPTRSSAAGTCPTTACIQSACRHN